VKRSELINDIRAILDLEPENENGVVAGGLGAGGDNLANPQQLLQMSNSNELSRRISPR